MIVIWIEGVDNSGKSTLAKQLAEAFNLEYRHCAKPKTDNPFLEYKELIKSVKVPTVFDRGFLGEFVYSQLWRGGLSMKMDEFTQLDDLCMELFGCKSVAIHADAPTHIIKQRCISEKEDLLQLNQIEKCQSLFREIMYHTKLPVISYFSHTQNPADIIEKLVNYL
jgi:thymidylate kinase